MGYEFSFGWAFTGLGVMIVATIFLRFYRLIADNLGSGIADYEHYKLYALIAIGIGFLTMLNIVPFLLYTVATMVFGGGAGGGAETTPVPSDDLL